MFFSFFVLVLLSIAVFLPQPPVQTREIDLEPLTALHQTVTELGGDDKVSNGFASQCDPCGILRHQLKRAQYLRMGKRAQYMRVGR
ncbi:unnamed protein product [Protopolystoma xenopodis]|uniref:Uncharacterized protein n=1 Tax=Protopolystoma xenopodis TaxID=117903 RepID=A0A448WJM4_9PLAT|nr:unnamed protein product [Protopolystoma xenopodis]